MYKQGGDWRALDERQMFPTPCPAGLLPPPTPDMVGWIIFITGAQGTLATLYLHWCELLNSV
jgi:hypothetical protein